MRQPFKMGLILHLQLVFQLVAPVHFYALCIIVGNVTVKMIELKEEKNMYNKYKLNKKKHKSKKNKKKKDKKKKLNKEKNFK